MQGVGLVVHSATLRLLPVLGMVQSQSHGTLGVPWSSEKILNNIDGLFSSSVIEMCRPEARETPGRGAASA